MWLFKKNDAKLCEPVCETLERTAIPQDGCAVSLAALLTTLPQSAQIHIRSCESCRAFAEELANVRGLLAGRQGIAQPGPFFLVRVMATIAGREAELEQAAQTWAAVPRLAYRLSVLAVLTLLLAGSWVYQMPRGTTTAGLTAQQEAGGLADLGSPQDDLLVSPAGR